MPYDGTNFVEVAEPQMVRDLRAARRRIEREEDWCGCGPFGPGNAVCAHVAVMLTSGDWGLVLGVLRKSLPAGGTIHAYNDSHTHAEVLALFDRAISRELERVG